jgi:hypothetical protein
MIRIGLRADDVGTEVQTSEREIHRRFDLLAFASQQRSAESFQMKHEEERKFGDFQLFAWMRGVLAFRTQPHCKIKLIEKETN